MVVQFTPHTSLRKTLALHVLLGGELVVCLVDGFEDALAYVAVLVAQVHVVVRVHHKHCLAVLQLHLHVGGAWASE